MKSEFNIRNTELKICLEVADIQQTAVRCEWEGYSVIKINNIVVNMLKQHVCLLLVMQIKLFNIINLYTQPYTVKDSSAFIPGIEILLKGQHSFGRHLEGKERPLFVHACQSTFEMFVHTAICWWRMMELWTWMDKANCEVVCAVYIRLVCL